MPTPTPVAQDLDVARQRLAAVFAPRPRRKSRGSRSISRGFKVTSREARALRVVARELGVRSFTGTVLLRVFSLEEVVAMYDHLVAGEPVRKSA